MKKTFDWFDEHGIPYEFIDYKKNDVAEQNLSNWFMRSGWEQLLNKKGLTWRKLSEEERLDVNESKARILLTKYPAMIKRPVIDTGDHLLVGFNPEILTKELGL